MKVDLVCTHRLYHSMVQSTVHRVHTPVSYCFYTASKRTRVPVSCENDFLDASNDIPYWCVNWRISISAYLISSACSVALALRC